MRQSLTSVGETIAIADGQLANGCSARRGSLNVVVLFVIVPVVAFYLLLDWDRMVARIDALLPRDHAPVIRLAATSTRRWPGSSAAGAGLPDPRRLLLVALMLVGLQLRPCRRRGAGG